MSQDDTGQGEATTTEVENNADQQFEDAFNEELQTEQSDETESNTPSDTGEAEETETESSDETPGNEPSKDAQKEQKRQGFEMRQAERQKRMQELQSSQRRYQQAEELEQEENPETGEPYTQAEIDDILRRQSREDSMARESQELMSLQIQQNQENISDEITSAMKDYGLLDPNSKDFNQDVANDYNDSLNEALIYADNEGNRATRGQILNAGMNPQDFTLIGSSVSPKKLAALAANSYSRARKQGEAVGQANSQRATEQMMANVDPSGNASGADATDDEDSFVKNFFN